MESDKGRGKVHNTQELIFLTNCMTLTTHPLTFHRTPDDDGCGFTNSETEH